MKFSFYAGFESYVSIMPFLLFLKLDSPASQLFLFKYPSMNNDRKVTLREK